MNKPIDSEDFGDETLAGEYVEVSPDNFEPAAKDTGLTVQVDEDFGDEAFHAGSDGIKVSGTSEATVQIDADASGIDLGKIEDSYKRRELIKEAAPVLIAQAEKLKEVQKERIKVEVHEALSGDVDRRLDKFEKRRRKVKRRECIGKFVKWGILAAVALTVYATPALRNRAVLVWQDAVEMVQDAVDGREVSSNKLLQDLFQPINSGTGKEGMRDE